MKKQAIITDIDNIMARIQRTFDVTEPEASLDQTKTNYSSFVVKRFMESIIDEIPMIRLSELVDYAMINNSYIPALIINANPGFYFMEIRNLQDVKSVMNVLSILSIEDFGAEEVCADALDRILSIEICIINNGKVSKQNLDEAKSSLPLGNNRIVNVIKNCINNGLTEDGYYCLYSYCKRLNDDVFTKFFFKNWIKVIASDSINIIFIYNQYKEKFPDDHQTLDVIDDKVSKMYATITDEVVKLPLMCKCLINMQNKKLLLYNINFLKNNVLKKVDTASKQELIDSIKLIDIFEESDNGKPYTFESYVKAFFALDPQFEEIMQMESNLIPRRTRSFSNYEIFGDAADRRVATIISELDNTETIKTIYQKIKKDNCYSQSKQAARKQIFKLTKS